MLVQENELKNKRNAGTMTWAKLSWRVKWMIARGEILNIKMFDYEGVKIIIKIKFYGSPKIQGLETQINDLENKTNSSPRKFSRE